MLPGLRLRQVRERLGLTYRDVERASHELAERRGRADFTLHISRLADIENHGVVPTLHKLYTLAAIYRLNPLDIFRWYDVPIEECFHDGMSCPVPQTHLMAAPTSLRTPIKFDPAFSRGWSKDGEALRVYSRTATATNSTDISARPTGA
jgi:transcriptional regulator with XRE-family HTH domain